MGIGGDASTIIPIFFEHFQKAAVLANSAGDDPLLAASIGPYRILEIGDCTIRNRLQGGTKTSCKANRRSQDYQARI